jgi:hypothetical protein
MKAAEKPVKVPEQATAPSPTPAKS